MERGTLTIESIAAGGDGVAHTGGLAVFIPRTAPGDVVEASWRQAGRFARGALERVVAPAPARVEPRCVHYVRDRCGGCQLQHVSDDAQREAKSRIVADALERIGRRPVRAPEVVAGASPWRYRRKLTLALRRSGDRWIAGLHPYDAPDRVFPLEDCLIAHSEVVQAWREVVAAADALPRSDRLRGAVRLEAEGPELALEGGTHWTTHAEFFERVPRLSALWWSPEGGRPGALHSRGAGRGAGDAFVQVNPGVAGAMRDWVLSRIAARGPRTVIDAYAGAGELSAALAAAGCGVTAIEVNRTAAERCRERLPAGSRAIRARVEDALPGALPADVVVLNPPRAGVAAAVTGALADAGGVRAIVYVSCDPATLARDLARLPAWRIASLVAFDMFPQTAHVETVCELERAS